MQEKPNAGRTVWVVVGGAALCVALVWGSLRWPEKLSAPGVPVGFPFQTTEESVRTVHPLVELLKLVVSALIGMVVTAVHRRSRRKKPLAPSLAQAQILLCVCGTLVMIIIGNSIGRAFGAFGIASIIRFRTPLKNPKDAAVLLLLLGLGMACGVGAFAVAGLGTIFVCLFLFILDRLGEEEERQRYMEVELVAEGSEFPSAHVQAVFSRHRIAFEPRQVSQGDEATVKYHIALDPNTSLEELSAQLMSNKASGIKSVAWESSTRGG